MKIEISFDKPILSEAQSLKLILSDVDSFYESASEIERTNLFFVFLASFHFYGEKNDTTRAAHISYLLSYYVFTALTPPASAELALYYIKQAIALNDRDEYDQWLTTVSLGN